MGTVSSTQQSRNGRVSTSSEHGRPSQLLQKPQLREHKRYGVVVIKYQTTSGTTRRGQETTVSQVATPRGVIMYGNLYNPTAIQRAINNSGFPMLVPQEMPVPDSRAHRLLVSYCQGWHLVPFPEIFSRHSGTCYVVGDRNNVGTPFQIKIGDCFRLGSVGLVVSEVKLPDMEEQRLDAKTLQFLKDEALAFDIQEEWAQLASDELEKELQQRQQQLSIDLTGNKSTKTMVEQDNSSAKSTLVHKEDDDGNDQIEDKPEDADRERKRTVSGEHYLGSGGVIGSANEKFFCYMCYETHNTLDDPLIAACECKGDTRFLHVQCLQKWYHSSALGSHAQVIRTTGSGAPACKICGAAYKTNFRRHDGKKASILETDNNGPYISLVVVTHHDTNPGLFNTKFRLKFGRNSLPSNVRETLTATEEETYNTILIGRSSSCAMVLDYRTVSTTHAKITYTNGKFYLTDERSSNGTLVYLQDPLPLPYGQSVKVRMGRTTLSLQAKRSWSSALRSYFFANNNSNNNTNNNSNSNSVHSHLDSRHNDQSLEEDVCTHNNNNSTRYDSERPSMTPHHFHQLQLHQQHLQQLRNNNNENNLNNLNNASQESMVDYSLLATHLSSMDPSPCDVQTFLAAISASLHDPNKMVHSANIDNNSNATSNGAFFFGPNAGHSHIINYDSNNNNNMSSNSNDIQNVSDLDRLEADFSATSLDNNSHVNNRQMPEVVMGGNTSPLIGTRANISPSNTLTSNNSNINHNTINNGATNSDIGVFGANPSAPPLILSDGRATFLSQQPSERTFIVAQDSHFFNTSFIANDNDYLSTVDNTVVAPLRSHQASFVMRPSIVNANNTNNGDNVDISGVEEGCGIVLPRHIDDHPTTNNTISDNNITTSNSNNILDNSIHNNVSNSSKNTAKWTKEVVSEAEEGLLTVAPSMATLPPMRNNNSNNNSVYNTTSNCETVVAAENGTVAHVPSQNHNNSNSNALLSETESLLGTLPAANRYALPSRHNINNNNTINNSTANTNVNSNNNSSRNSPVPHNAHENI